MRPIDKAKSGESIVYTDSQGRIIHKVIEDNYSPYIKAKIPLIGNVGNYCSYCEGANHPSNLSIEHLASKGKGGSETSWDNFLLSCTICNSVKGAKVLDKNYHWPHLNNTFLSFIYDYTGRVRVNPNIPEISKEKAHNLLDLIKLQRYPNTEEKPSEMDYRWQRRYEIWNKAVRLKKYFIEDKITVDDIIEEVKYRGYWSVWFTVFEGIDIVLEHLISDIPGTCANCFDKNNHYSPVQRNPGCDDPI